MQSYNYIVILLGPQANKADLMSVICALNRSKANETYSIIRVYITISFPKGRKYITRVIYVHKIK
jgi:hypothetical protein